MSTDKNKQYVYQCFNRLVIVVFLDMTNQFIIKNTMADLRSLSAAEIASLEGTNPDYAGILLLGYYQKGDTPNPVLYFLSTTTEQDDGGSVIHISNIKVKHNFTGEINVKYFGIFESITDNSIQINNIIKLINVDITGIIICNSIIKFGSRLVFENKENFTLILENSTLLDSTKVLPNQAGTGEGRVPFGILFKNCKNFVLNGLKCQSNCNAWFEVAVLEKDNLYPHIEFNKCSKFTLNNVQCNGYVGGYLSLNNIEPIPYDIMRGSYVTFYQSTDFSINGFDIAQGAGGGEFLSINKCENIKIKSVTHDQGNSNITFWSLGKFIDNKNLVVDGLRIKSNSTGSLFDIAGENITIQNGILDYILGKVLDVTFEWGQLNIDTKDVTLRNIKTNGVVCISAGHASNSILTRINFDNVVSTVEGTPQVYNLRGIESLEIRNTEFKNNQNIISMVPLEAILRKPKKILISKSNITFESPSPSDLSVVELCGLTEWKDSSFGGDSNLLGIRLLDRFAEVTNQTDLSTSFSKIVFSNCNFKNLSIAVPVNVEFINCTFTNVRFFNTSITYSKMTVKFRNCYLNYTNINPLVSAADRWFEFTSNIPFTLIFDSTEFNGKLTNPTGLSIFGGMVNSGSTVRFINNCVWSIVRVGGGVFALFPINESSNINLEFINSDFNSTNIISLTGGAALKEGRVNIKIMGGNYNTNFISIGANNNLETNSKISLSIIGVNTLTSLITNVFNISGQFFNSRFDWTNFPLGSIEGKGLVKQANVSANSALAPGTTYTQEEIHGILMELRDLKTKLIMAGILAN